MGNVMVGGGGMGCERGGSEWAGLGRGGVVYFTCDCGKGRGFGFGEKQCRMGGVWARGRGIQAGLVLTGGVA